jgi:hypothetical protein
MTSKDRNIRKEKLEIVRHPYQDDKFILIAEQPNGRKIAFEIDQPGK